MVKVNVSGRTWKTEHKPTQKKSEWKLREKERAQLEIIKAKEKELKGDKQKTHDDSIARIKERREKKAEQERYAKLEAVMHKKRVDRIRRREKRNKLLKER